MTLWDTRPTTDASNAPQAKARSPHAQPSQVYRHILEEAGAGGQAYIICPLVEESSAPGFDDLRAVTEEHARLTQEGVLPGHLCGLLHGRMTGKRLRGGGEVREYAQGGPH